MQLIRCTQKLQKEMGLKKVDLSTAETDNSRLGEWYANLIYMERRKCVVFVNKKTLFSFFVPNVKRNQIRRLDELFLMFFINTVLFGMGLDFITVELLDEYENIHYAKTDSRSVLGSMNDITMNYRYFVDYEGGLYSCNLLEIIKRVNGIPFKALNYSLPVKAFKAIYGL